MLSWWCKIPAWDQDSFVLRIWNHCRMMQLNQEVGYTNRLLSCSNKKYSVFSKIIIVSYNSVTLLSYLFFGDSMASCLLPITPWILDIFFYSHQLSVWYCIDTVKRNSVLVTHWSFLFLSFSQCKPSLLIPFYTSWVLLWPSLFTNQAALFMLFSSWFIALASSAHLKSSAAFV